jgi:transcriptional regulator with XRE-family HTH domain
MDSGSAWYRLPAAREAAADADFGAVLRLARVAAGWTLAQAGQRAGYSAATMSRFETGVRALRDVTTLRHFAVIFRIPPEMFGLTATGVAGRADQALGSIVDADQSATGGGEPVHRRMLLVGLAGGPLLAGTKASSANPPTGTPGSLVASLETLVLRPHEQAGGGDRNRLAGRLARIKADFQACRYAAVAEALPALIADSTHHGAADPTSAAVLAETYNTAANILIKLDAPGPGWIAADRATAAARSCGDPVVVASVTRNMVSLCRREHRFATAQQLAVDAAEDLDMAAAAPDPAHLSMYGLLMCNAGYAAAQAGDRSRCTELLHLADRAAQRLGGDRNAHWSAFGPTNVVSHRISASVALGDAGTAIQHAATIPAAAIRITERAVRIWFDVARAYHQWQKPDKCLRALLIAERIAPEEVRHRPAVREIVLDLLSAPSTPSMAGARELAQRVGCAA